MIHFVNSLCSTVFVYAIITRGGLAVSRGLEYLSRKPG